MKTFLALVGVVFAGLLFIGIVPRVREARELTAENTSIHRAPPVAVIAVHRGQPTTDLLLPGTVEALHEAAIYARATGYVTSWVTDIGAHVKEGQLMALIEAPDLDQQTDQAKASLGQLRADSALAKANLARWETLFKTDVVTKEELDTRQATYDDATANLDAGLANYHRLLELQRYERVLAPFSGVVTSRSLDVGQLVTNGSTMGTTGSASARPLFTVDGTDTVRVYINVPEDVLPFVRVGETAEVLVQAAPPGLFQGRVTRTAQAIDAASRTLLTEVQVANPKSILLPGMYAQVRFLVHRDHSPVVIPANTLMVRSDGAEVAIVGPDHKVRFQKVDLGRDYGSTIEVTAGLTDGQNLVVNPSDDIQDGMAVTVLPVVTETAGH